MADILKLLKETDDKKSEKVERPKLTSSEPDMSKVVNKPKKKRKVTRKLKLCYDLGIKRENYNKFKAKRDSYSITIDNLDYETFKVLAQRYLC